MTQLDRRTALISGLGAAALPLVAHAAPSDPLSGDALYANVKGYSLLGEHRTGTSGDAAGTGWLMTSLEARGFKAERQGFDYPVFELGACGIALGGQALEAFPYWTPTATPAGGVTAPLSLAGGAGKIALVDLPPGTGAGLDAPPPAQIIAAVDNGSAAVIAVTENPLGELLAMNRNPKAPAWRCPVLLAAGRDLGALKAAAQAGAPVTVRLEGQVRPHQAQNVIGRRVRPGKPVVISTPKSGWRHCAGERGSGIAIWLGLAAALAKRDDLNLIFVCSSGHEFDGYGAHLFTETLAPKPAETRLWVAIGANVAVYDHALRDGTVTRLPGPPKARTIGASAPLTAMTAQAFAGQPGYETPLDLDAHDAPGELATFRKLGYRPLIGLVAASPLHHSAKDLPEVTGPAVLEPVAKALHRTILGALT
ncbi:hypothetical protein [Phenylobacterium sp.]|uniref:hypothetical protein n=1 Tax=Phenylobacterium sp. TaxID=1871053 RepID=UPI0011F93F97|nr:hypothetical protein [Phenylobacterium sp.]THD58535.1 MAG: hypothetical protein E8A49_18590 [Phenylobacterium sp.]